MTAMSMGCPLLEQIPHRSYDEAGAHVLEVEIVDEIRGPAGAVHGGVIASIVDRAAAYAAVQATSNPVVTSSVALSYLDPATEGPLRASAVVLRAGRRQGVVEVRVHDVGRDNLLVATALLTVSYVAGEIPQPTSDEDRPG
jgi:uncharacterized protein (TIGR00369 family)